jgi:hypothetical protein
MADLRGGLQQYPHDEPWLLKIEELQLGHFFRIQNNTAAVFYSLQLHSTAE